MQIRLPNGQIGPTNLQSIAKIRPTKLTHVLITD